MIVSALDRKLIRDLLQMKGQVLAICAVIAAGIATVVMSLSTLESLKWSKDTYYERYAFADVFSQMKRAPLALADQIRELPGVATVAPRVTFDVTLDVEDMVEPAVGRLISIPDTGEPALNRLYIRRGRALTPYSSREVLVGEPFAESHNLDPGDTVTAIINGRRQQLTIVGIVISPEYLIQIRAGSLLPDDKRFGIFYMGYNGLAAALDMDGAFNNVTLSLMRGADEEEVITRLDDLTERYGGVGAYGREHHTSHQYISDEMRQLRSMGIIGPSIFLSVAAFLLNVVITRLINTQREQIAALKAFGYSSFAVALHYLKMVLVIPFAGTLIGTFFGSWMGSGLTVMYARFYRFPVFTFTPNFAVIMLAFGLSALAGIIGTLAAVRRAMALPPAQAMRPEPPPNYRPTWVERVGLSSWLPQTTRMILRNLERRPIKALFSVLGIGMAAAVLILGSFMLDAVTYIMDFQFRLQQRQDLLVTFVEPSSSRAIHEVEHLPGVMQCEAFRGVPVRLRFGHRDKLTSILGLPEESRLYRIMDQDERVVSIPEHGIVLSQKLGDILHAKPGDLITVEVQEGERPIRKVPLIGLVREFSGLNAYMALPTLHRLMSEGEVSSGAYLSVDERYLNELYETLKETPRVAGVTIKSAMLSSFEDTVAENLLRMRAFNVMFATIIAFGVVYNGARISLSERARELSTLRVIGFTRGEISGILLGELAILTILGIPIGLLMGYLFAAWSVSGLDTEIYRIPLVVSSQTFAFAAVTVLVATVLSGLIVRRRLDHLDLVSVLKSKE